VTILPLIEEVNESKTELINKGIISPEILKSSGKKSKRWTGPKLEIVVDLYDQSQDRLMESEFTSTAEEIATFKRITLIPKDTIAQSTIDLTGDAQLLDNLIYTWSPCGAHETESGKFLLAKTQVTTIPSKRPLPTCKFPSS
jgi:hypothetical protein